MANAATKDKLNLNKLAKDSLKLLKKERSREVLALRYGIDGNRETLEKIGTSYGITRERVRQIEKSAITFLKKQNLEEIKEIKQLFDTIIKEKIASFDQLKDVYGENAFNACRFLLNLNSDIIELAEDDRKKATFAIKQINEKMLDDFLKRAVGVLHKADDHLKYDVFLKELKIVAMQNNFPEELVKKTLAISKQIILDGEDVGLSNWSTINPKSIKDKTHYILRKHGEPLHFDTISKKVRNISNKQITKQAVHNELIRDERFVLVGRGIYALSEWGFKNGTVSEIIEEVLNEHTSLHKNDIVEKVLERRIVKETTIILNLQNKNKFMRVGKATYSIRSN